MFDNNNPTDLWVLNDSDLEDVHQPGFGREQHASGTPVNAHGR